MAAHSWNGCICTCLLLENKCKYSKTDEKVCELHIKKPSYVANKRKGKKKKKVLFQIQITPSVLDWVHAQVVSKSATSRISKHILNNIANTVCVLGFLSPVHNNLSSLLALQTHLWKSGCYWQEGSFPVKATQVVCLSLSGEKTPSHEKQVWGFYHASKLWLMMENCWWDFLGFIYED